MLGICNGFQVLLELGLLPGAMLRNKNLKFLCQNVHLRIENSDTPFTNKGKKGQILNIPIAHFDGNYYIDGTDLDKIKKNNQIVLRYSNAQGLLTEEDNVNGSMECIAGLANENKNVLGMMPHPERASEALLGSRNGHIIFDSIIDYIKNDR